MQRLRDRYGARLERLEQRIEGQQDEHGQSDVAVAGRLLAEMIDAERDALKAMRAERAVGAEVLTRDRARTGPRRVPPARPDPALTR